MSLENVEIEYKLTFITFDIEKNETSFRVYVTEHVELLVRIMLEIAESILSYEGDYEDADYSPFGRNHYRVKTEFLSFVFLRGKRDISLEQAEALLDCMCVDKYLTQRYVNSKIYSYHIKKTRS